MASKYDFTANSGNQSDLAGILETASTNYQTKIDDLFKQINTEMAGAWQGEDYNEFVNSSNAYKGAIEDVGHGILTFSRHFRTMSGETDTLATNIYGLLQDMSGAKAAGFEHGGPIQAATQASTGEGYQDSGYESGEFTTVGEATEATEVSPTPTPGHKTDGYFIQRGDKCVVDGQEVEFFLRDGSYNYYKDAQGRVLIQKNGKLEDTGHLADNFIVTYAEDPDNGWYTSVSTSTQGAKGLGLPAVTEPCNKEYDRFNSGYELVDVGIVTPEMNVGTPTNLGEWQQMVATHQEVIQVPRVDVPWLSAGSDLTPNPGETYVTLVYDERSNMYYQLEDGKYARGGRGFEPETLVKYGVKF